MTDAIASASFAELAEAGWAGTSMDAVVRRAGVGKAALYRRWPSKQAMLAELIRRRVEDTAPVPPGTGALGTDLRALLAGFRDQLAEPAVRRIGLGLLAEAQVSAELSEILLIAVAAPRRAVAWSVLEAAIERGELSAGLDMDVAIDLLIAPIVFRMLVLGDTRTEEASLDVLVAAVEGALHAMSS